MNPMFWIGGTLFLAGVGALITRYAGLQAFLTWLVWTVALAGLLIALIGLNR